MYITIGFTCTCIYRRQQKKKRWLGSIKQLINMVQGPCRWAQTAADVFAGLLLNIITRVCVYCCYTICTYISFKEMYILFIINFTQLLDGWVHELYIVKKWFCLCPRYKTRPIASILDEFIYFRLRPFHSICGKSIFFLINLIGYLFFFVIVIIIARCFFAIGLITFFIMYMDARRCVYIV